MSHFWNFSTERNSSKSVRLKLKPDQKKSLKKNSDFLCVMTYSRRRPRHFLQSTAGRPFHHTLKMKCMTACLLASNFFNVVPSVRRHLSTTVFNVHLLKEELNLLLDGESSHLE